MQTLASLVFALTLTGVPAVAEPETNYVIELRPVTWTVLSLEPKFDPPWLPVSRCNILKTQGGWQPGAAERDMVLDPLVFDALFEKNCIECVILDSPKLVIWAVRGEEGADASPR